MELVQGVQAGNAEENRVLKYNGILVPVRTSFGLRRRGGRTYNVSTYNVDMLNAVKSVLADVLSVSLSSEFTLNSLL